MKLSLYKFVGLLIISVILGSACKRNETQNHVSLQVMALADRINAAPDTTLAGGLILTGCSIDEKDSLFTYTITVPDDRFNNLPADSIKARFAHDLHDSSRRKLIRTLTDNSLGLRYICTLPDSIVTIVFNPEELSSNYLKDS